MTGLAGIPSRWPVWRRLGQSFDRCAKLRVVCFGRCIEIDHVLKILESLRVYGLESHAPLLGDQRGQRWLLRQAAYRGTLCIAPSLPISSEGSIAAALATVPGDLATNARRGAAHPLRHRPDGVASTGGRGWSRGLR